MTVAGQTFELYHHDVLKCIESLFGNPEFTPHLILAPERHYVDQVKTSRVYHDMHTGQWWWEMQVRLNLLRRGLIIKHHTETL